MSALNRRVLVTAEPARAELEVDLHGPATVVLTVEPVGVTFER